MALKIAISGSEGECSLFGEVPLSGNIVASQRVKYSRVPRICGDPNCRLRRAENDGGALQVTMFHVKRPG